MLPLLTATRFLKVMDSGRTQPCLKACEDAEGKEIETVVKLRGHPQIVPGACPGRSIRAEGETCTILDLSAT